MSYFNEMQKDELKKLYDKIKRHYEPESDLEKDMKNPINASVGGYIGYDKLDDMLSRTNTSAYVNIEICADDTSTKKNSFWYCIMACAEFDTDKYFDSYEETILEEEKDNVTVDQIYNAIEEAFDELYSRLDASY